MTDLTLTVTDAGRIALINAANTGTAPVTIAQVGVSPTAVVPAANLTALAGETKRIATISGDVVADDTIHLIVRDESADNYTVRSFALYLNDGTLFAIYGQADAIMEKSAQSLLLLAIDVRFADIDATDLTFGDTNFLNPPATTTAQGVVELATDAEAVTGTDTVRAVTPKAGKAATTAALDSRLGANAPTDFVKTLLVALSAGGFRSLLGLKGAALKDEGSGNNLDADRLDGQEGSYYANIPARLGFTPLNAAAYTPADILAKLLGVDGSGSGLDADLLDGWDRDAIRAWGNITGKPFNYAGQAGQPPWLWGTNDGVSYYVWNPANFSVAYASDADRLDGYHEGSFLRILSSSLGSPGYIAFSNGLKIQWGTSVSVANGTVTVTYPASFSSFSIALCSGARVDVNAQDNDPGVTFSGTSNFNVFSAADIPIGFRWIAIGV